MALGGGTFTSRNKILPGTYINFVSVANASPTLSDRGVAAMGLELDWGTDDEVFRVDVGDFQKNTMKIFGHDYADDSMKGLRDLFLNVQTLYAYKLNSGSKASNDFAKARCSGERGNDITIVIQENEDDSSKYDVETYIDSQAIDSQTVESAEGLVDNDYVEFIKDAELSVTAGTPLSGGDNGSEVTAADHQKFLNKIESYSFNALGVVSEDKDINSLYSRFAEDMRENHGIKFQAVTWNNAADYEGNVNVKNSILDEGWPKASLCYFVTGIIAGCAVNASNTNMTYDGEFDVDTSYTQNELENSILSGEFVMHNVNEEVHVLMDINSLVTFTEEKGQIFQDNQTIRVIDQIANDVATTFNTKYLGKVPNDESGRISLWTDIVKLFNNLATIRAIEDFDSGEITVEQGDNKNQVVVTSGLTVINSMTHLYMTTTVE